MSISETEYAQLGTTKDNGMTYIKNLNDWLKFRKFLVEKSEKRNPDFFDENLAAYTPGETVQLLKKKEIVAWFKKLDSFVLPSDVEAVILVPCAASKPWFNHKNVNKSKLYSAYNNLIKDVENKNFPKVYFLTISEPLGIVPQQYWDNFPKYDNPGLFKDDFLRTGLVKSDWEKTFLKSRHVLPFDEAAYLSCIEKLAQVIEKILNKIDVPIISFVDAKEHTTHGHMLDVVEKINPSITILRHNKKKESRRSPYDYMKETITNELTKPNNKNKIR